MTNDTDFSLSRVPCSTELDRTMAEVLGCGLLSMVPRDRLSAVVQEAPSQHAADGQLTASDLEHNRDVIRHLDEYLIGRDDHLYTCDGPDDSE